jgi:hypothetical protein
MSTISGIIETFNAVNYNINENIKKYTQLEENKLIDDESKNLVKTIKLVLINIRDNISHLKTQTIEYDKELISEINELKNKNTILTTKLENLENESKIEIKELKQENKTSKEQIKELQLMLNDDSKEKKYDKMIDNIRISLSDIYNNKNKKMKQMFKIMILDGIYKQEEINKINTLDKIINTYRDWKKFKEHKNIDNLDNLKQFKHIIIPNVEKWKLNLDVYNCLYGINKHRNKQYHKNKTEIREILNNLSTLPISEIKKLDIHKDLPKHLNTIITLI